MTISQFEQQFGKEPLGKNLAREARRLVREGMEESAATSKVVEQRIAQVEANLSDLDYGRSSTVG